MYADDSIMCCLFPNRCNLFSQTSVNSFWYYTGCANMLIVISSVIFVVWSLMRILKRSVEKKESELIEQNDSEEEQLIQKEVKTISNLDDSDECLFYGNNSDGDGDKPCSDSDLNVSKSFKRRLEKHDRSNSDCLNFNLEPSTEVLSIDITNGSKRSFNSNKRNCDSSSSDEREERNHNMEHLEQHNIKYATVHESTITVIPEEELGFLNISQEDTNNNNPKNTLPVSNTDSKQ